MKASIILVGTELLSGGTVDTNSIFMAEELNKYGIEIKYKLTTKDTIEDIMIALEFARKNSDLIITSGGLGPTIDDITKDAVAKFLGKRIIVDEEDFKVMKQKFEERRIKYTPNNIKQVEKPEGAISIENQVGMCPAVYIDDIVSFPGVPSEVYDMFPRFLKWYVEEKKLLIDKIYIKDLLVYGLGESYIDQQISELFTEEGIDYEFLVKDFGIIIRLQGKNSNKNIVEKISEKIYNIIGDNIFGEGNDRLENLVITKLKEKNLSFSVAESCTGGLLAGKIVSVSGASEVFKEGLVTYSNEAKMEKLGVKEETLKKYGAVSEETALEMVKGLKTDVGISVTGIAGPLGGTKEKPVGLVYFGIKVRDKFKVEKRILVGPRNKIRERATLQSLFYLNKMLKGNA
ncbi:MULTISPECIES: CinA family nicotinamide mononucleotide deamidase-related protein [Fusobacterium]|uniref:CinA family nicotinamide mononucleotide deamidase-related protein n=1 Tax=Fusobacterium TaxID=848 RepID=UPI0014778595|nr:MULTISPECIES: CinA family nicotinamide mononucleotide deamidase-related protein [Fusobacterium]NME36313.1 CinA family nicotinamide mononucleotide deamidase-related protein [Fusobacterium sp. FSA-380-WT-3A]